MVTGVTSATRVVKMKDGEKGLLALAVVGGYLYMSKTKPGAKQSMGDGRPYGDGTYGTHGRGGDDWVIGLRWHSSRQGPMGQGNKGLVLVTGSVGNAKKGGIFNALRPVVGLQPEEIRLLDDDDDKSAQQIMRENKARRSTQSGMCRKDQEILMRSMNLEQRRAYLAKAGIMMGDR